MLSLGTEPVGYSAADMTSDMLRQSKFEQPSKQIPFMGELMTGTPVNIGDRHNPSLEAIAQLQPDLIIGETWQKDGKYELLSQIAPTILVEHEESGWQGALPVLAKALGKEEQSERVIAAYEMTVAEVRSQLTSVARQYPQVLLISSGNLSGEIYLYNDSIFTRILEDIGFQIFPVEGKDGVLSLEAMPGIAADIVIVVAWDDASSGVIEDVEKRRREWNETPLLQKMPASKEGKVYFIDARLSTLRGPIAAKAILEDYLQYLKPSEDS